MGVVMCNPLAEEKVIAHRIMVNMARALSRAGIFCLRFDYMGSGDSDGKFEESTIETMLADTKAAVERFRAWTGVDRPGLLGVRFGGTLGMQFAETNEFVDRLILVEPIADGKSYMEECLRSNLTLQMAAYKRVIHNRKALKERLMAGKEVSIDGYQLTKTLFEQIGAVSLRNLQRDKKKRTLVIGMERGASSRSGESVLSKVCRQYQSEGFDFQFERVEEVPFWTDQRVHKPFSAKLEEIIVGWVLKTCSQT